MGEGTRVLLLFKCGTVTVRDLQERLGLRASTEIDESTFYVSPNVPESLPLGEHISAFIREFGHIPVQFPAGWKARVKAKVVIEVSCLHPADEYGAPSGWIGGELPAFCAALNADLVYKARDVLCTDEVTGIGAQA